MVNENQESCCFLWKEVIEAKVGKLTYKSIRGEQIFFFNNKYFRLCGLYTDDVAYFSLFIFTK